MVLFIFPSFPMTPRGPRTYPTNNRMPCPTCKFPAQFKVKFDSLAMFFYKDLREPDMNRPSFNNGLGRIDKER
jgi:hypothetical protein